MKISYVNKYPLFKSNSKASDEKDKKKLNTETKLLIGATIAATGLIAVRHFTKNKNPKTIKNITSVTDGDKIEKTVFDKNGKLIKKQSSILKTEFIMKDIPVGLIRTTTVSDGSKRITQYRLDGTPLKTISNNKTIIYLYNRYNLKKIVGHIYIQGDKYILKLNKNKKFRKIFNSLECIYKWSKHILTN